MVTNFADDNVRQLARTVGCNELLINPVGRLELSACGPNPRGTRPVSKLAMSKGKALEAVDSGALTKILAERDRLRAFHAHEHSAVEEPARIEEAGHICPVLRLIDEMSILK